MSEKALNMPIARDENRCDVSLFLVDTEIYLHHAECFAIVRLLLRNTNKKRSEVSGSCGENNRNGGMFFCSDFGYFLLELREEILMYICCCQTKRFDSGVLKAGSSVRGRPGSLKINSR